MREAQQRFRSDTSGTVAALASGQSVLFLLAWGLIEVQKACQCPREAALGQFRLDELAFNRTIGYGWW